MEIREPKFKVGDKVYCKHYESSATITGVSDYSFNKDKFFYNVEWEYDDYWDEISEDLLEPYIEKPKSVWDLQNGDTYYVFDYDVMNVRSVKFLDDTDDINYRELGNCFLTKEEAESELERVKIEAEMLRLGGRRKFKEGENNWYIFYDFYTGHVDYDYDVYDNCGQGTIYFDSTKEVQNVIERVGKKRIKKYIFGVE